MAEAVQEPEPVQNPEGESVEPKVEGAVAATPADGAQANGGKKDEEKLCASVVKGEQCWTQKSGKQCPFSHEVPSYHKNIYICHLPLTYTKEELEKLIVSYGKVNEVKILVDPRSGRSRGVGFIHFDRHEDAKGAIAGVHDMQLPNHSQPLQARFARITKNKDGSRISKSGGRGGGRGGRRRDDDRGDRRGGRGRDFGRDSGRDRFARRPRRDPYDDPYFDDYYDDYDYRPRGRPAPYGAPSYGPPPAYSAPGPYPASYSPYGPRYGR